MSTTIDDLRMATSRIDNVSTRLDALQHLFKCDDANVQYTDEGVEIGSVELQHIFHNDHATVTYVVYKKDEAYLPMHAHDESHEYLIIAKGKFLMKFRGGHGRIMGSGECSSIPMNTEHTCIALTEGAELIAICVPPEDAYKLGRV